MPYALSLQNFVLPEFSAQAPDSWEKRLREISEIRSDTSHLRFRKFAPRDDWKESPFNLQPDRPLWAVYACTPKHLVIPEKAEAFRLHWSEIPLRPESEFPESEQVAHRVIVSDYQHYMWHANGLSVFPLWLLQGEWGGTPMKYTKRETRYLDASGLSSVPAPPGAFTPCPFDERAVKGLVARDRLVQASNNYDELERMNRPEWKKAEDDAAEVLYRETMLDTLKVMNAPAVAFMQSNIGRRQAEEYLPPAPKGLGHTLATWKEVWMQTGKMPMVGPAPMKKVFATS